jgi:hypothetical protein
MIIQVYITRRTGLRALLFHVEGYVSSRGLLSDHSATCRDRNRPSFFLGPADRRRCLGVLCGRLVSTLPSGRHLADVLSVASIRASAGSCTDLRRLRRVNKLVLQWQTFRNASAAAACRDFISLRSSAWWSSWRASASTASSCSRSTATCSGSLRCSAIRATASIR